MTVTPSGQLVEALKDAHAMEVKGFEDLESMIATTRDRDFLAVLEQHRRRTHDHARRLEERLADHGHEASSAKDLGGTLKATAKAFSDQLRDAKPVKNARDAYAAAHTEIGAYAVLELIAERGGDAQTAIVARENRHDEEAIAAWIADRWDHFVDLTLDEPERAG